MSDVVIATATVPTFTDKYCTQAQSDADPAGTKDKLIISNDTYALGESQERVFKELCFKIGRMRLR